MSTLELCEEYFGTRDVYKLLHLEKSALLKDIKKAYYKLSLQVHPDRVPEALKANATEKFKVLSKLYQVLSDKEKRALYDEQGVIDDDEDGLESKLTNWLDLWRKIFKPLTTEDINNYEKSYVGSELERSDIRKAYLSGKGCINHMMNEVPFLKIEDEPRLQEIVREMIAAKEVPEYDIFVNEPEQKRKRRHKKYARESKEADKIKAKLNAEKGSGSGTGSANGSLEQAIMERQRSREENYNSLMDKLLQKYGSEDGSDAIEIESLGKGKNKKKKKASAVSKQKGSKLHSVNNGKVKKRSK